MKRTAMLCLLVLVACGGQDSPTGPKPILDPLNGGQYYQILRGDRVTWNFRSGEYFIVITSEDRTLLRAHGVYNVYRDVTTDPPGWGLRGTRLEVEQDGNVNDSPVPFDVPLFIGVGVIQIGEEVLIRE